MNGRVYDPAIGRFISADPKIQDIGYSQSFNRYQYVFGNPMAYIDPTGFDGCGGTLSVPTATDGGGASDCGSSITADTDWGCGGPGEPACQIGKVTVNCDRVCAEIAGAATAFVNWLLDSAQGPSSQNETPDGGKDKSSDKNKNKNNDKNKSDCGSGNSTSLAPHSFGVTAGAAAEAGNGSNAGAAIMGALGAGVFFDSKGNASTGTFATAGAVAYGPSSGQGSSSASAVPQTTAPSVVGGSASGGISLFASNATNVGQLSGAFTTQTDTIGEGPFQVSGQLSTGTDANGNFIYQVSVSPPGAGEASGASASTITTNTVTSANSGGNQQNSNGCSGH